VEPGKRARRGAVNRAARQSGGMTAETSDDPDGVLTAAQQDPTQEENLGAGPDRTDAPTGDRAADRPDLDDRTDLDDVPNAPAGPAATPADPDQPLNPA
jgi:hypothetical protein